MSYVLEIADQFLCRCSHVAILDPADFSIIAEWEKQDIPLSVILASIDEVCGEKKNTINIGSIADIQDQVKTNFIAWLQNTNGQKYSM